MRVNDIGLFYEALRRLNGKTHGDTLAIFLAFKYQQKLLPKVGDSGEGVPSRVLEDLLDDFYTKHHIELGANDDSVCRIFNNKFTPTKSYSQNNWRDFFRYGLGIGCLAPESTFSSAFLKQHRSNCQYLTTNSDGDNACELHPTKTRYIRSLDKPKLLNWKLKGVKGAYKLVDVNDWGLVDVIRPLSRRVPLESLIIALYFGAHWNDNEEVLIEQFAHDFNFDSVDQVEYLFAFDLNDPVTLKRITQVKREIVSALSKPFSLIEDVKTRTTTTERKIRSRAFMEAIREAYDCACAVCGLKFDTPEGKWEVQAAHIFPREHSGSDDVRNGIALCRTHHWAFDEHVFTIDQTYNLIWHEKAKPTAMYVEGKIRLPPSPQQWPDQEEALKWHREQFASIDKRRKNRRHKEKK